MTESQPPLNDLEKQISTLKQQLASLEGMRAILGDAAFVAASTPIRQRIDQLVQTAGGAYIAGDVRTDSGDVTGRDKYEVSAGGNIQAPVVAGQGNITIINLPLSTKDHRARYLDAFSRACQSLPLAAMGADENTDLDVSLDQVYIDLDTTSPVPETEEEKKEREKRPWDHQEKFVSALEAAAQTRRFVLLGDPGSGKSTFARRLAGWVADSQLKAVEGPPGFPTNLLPVMLALRDLAPRLEEIADYDQLSGAKQETCLLNAFYATLRADLQAWGVEGFYPEIPETMQSGQVLLVLDGLDEVAYHLRQRVGQAVSVLARRLKPAWFMVTCRVRSYAGSAELPGFQAYTLRPFTEEKICGFVAAWYHTQFLLGRYNQQQADQKAENLAQAALGGDLQELSSNPMLLTTMAIIHQREIGLPSERVRLYKLAVEVLLRRWQRYKLGDQAPSPELAALLKNDLKLLAVMEQLAYEAHQSAGSHPVQTSSDSSAEAGGAADLPRLRAIEILSTPEYLHSLDLAHQLLDYIDQRAGLLLGRGGEPGRPAVYSFPHRTFQEYLAGCYLAGQRDLKRDFYSLAASGDPGARAALLSFEELYYNRRGENALFDLAYGLCPACAPDTAQRQRAILWAGQVAALLGTEAIERDTNSPENGSAFLARLRSSLVAVLGGCLSPAERADAGNALARLGDPRFDPDWFYLPKDETLGFIEVPEGAFLMGSDPKQGTAAQDDEQPLHQVRLSVFYLARFPVTVAQFHAFVEQTGYKPSGSNCLRGHANHPVILVTWHDAQAYCDWLDKALRERSDTPDALKALFNDRFRVCLPTEAQWEKAARGMDGRVYPWDGEFDPNKANTGETQLRSTSPMGCFPNGASPYGIQDMSGNVLEWCADWYGEYETSSDLDPQGPKKGSSRVLRGGSWGGDQGHARCAFRSYVSPGSGGSGMGFRCVLSR